MHHQLIIHPAEARRLSAQLVAPALAPLHDHIVAGRSILPGAAMFEMALAAGRALCNMVWEARTCLAHPLGRRRSMLLRNRCGNGLKLARQRLWQQLLQRVTYF